MHYRRYRSDQSAVASAAITTLRGRKVPFGYVLEVTILSCYDVTESGNIVQIGYLDAVEDFNTVKAEGGGDFYGVSLSGPIWIEEGETPAGRITTPGNSDELFFSCHGRLWPKDKVGLTDAEVQQEDNLPD